METKNSLRLCYLIGFENIQQRGIAEMLDIMSRRHATNLVMTLAWINIGAKVERDTIRTSRLIRRNQKEL